MSTADEIPPPQLEDVVRFFQGKEGAAILQRHAGPGAAPERFEVLKSGGSAALLKRVDGHPVALGARRAVPRGELEVVRLDPAGDHAFRGRRLLRGDTLIAGLCAPLFDLEKLRLVAYHPERRAVVRLEGRGRDGTQVVFFAKLLRRKAYKRASALHASLRDRGAPAAELVLPVLALDDYATFIFPPAPGRSLNEVLLSGAWPDVAALAEGLRGLRSIDPQEALAPHDLEAEWGVTLKILDRGIKMMPELAALQRLVAQIEVPDCGTGVWAHRDLHDKQIFIGAGPMSVIDFESAAMAPAYWDVVNLAEHCRLRALQSRALHGDNLAEVLLDELEVDRNVAEIRLFTGFTRARLAGIYAMRPRWSALSRNLAEDALRLITEVP